MTGTTHFITGAAIGRLTGNPILAVIFGFLFHFIMDLVPHWDYGYHFKKKLGSFLIAASDPLIGFLVYLIIGLWQNFSLETWIITFVGGVFCTLPDVMSVGIKTFKIKKLGFFLKFHDKLHWFLKKDFDVFEWKETPINIKGFALGILWQIPFLVASIYFLIR